MSLLSCTFWPRRVRDRNKRELASFILFNIIVVICERLALICFDRLFSDYLAGWLSSRS